MRPILAPLLLAGLLGACGPDVGLDALASAGRGRVVAAPAGDALTLANGLQVRLAGIEAPHGDEPYAVQATAALTRLAVGHDVELMQGGATADPSGRMLAQARVARTRLWLEGALLSEGAARVRTYDDNRALAGPMLAQEAQARVAGRGLWALSAYRVRLPQEVAADDRGLIVVEGRVRRVVREGGVLRIELAEAPQGLAALLPRKAWGDFTAAGIPPASLAGALVRLRGEVRDGRDGPVLWIDHPEQVERLRQPKP